MWIWIHNFLRKDYSPPAAQYTIQTSIKRFPIWFMMLHGCLLGCPQLFYSTSENMHLIFSVYWSWNNNTWSKHSSLQGLQEEEANWLCTAVLSSVWQRENPQTVSWPKFHTIFLPFSCQEKLGKIIWYDRWWLLDWSSGRTWIIVG